jgi:hypothetical protein
VDFPVEPCRGSVLGEAGRWATAVAGRIAGPPRVKRRTRISSGVGKGLCGSDEAFGCQEFGAGLGVEFDAEFGADFGAEVVAVGLQEAAAHAFQNEPLAV